MSNYKEQSETTLNSFQNHYDYNIDYLRRFLNASEGAFKVFEHFQAMSSYRSALPVDAFFVAKIATALTEDCGSCTELNVKMAREAGVDEAVITGACQKGKGLTPELEQVRRYAIGVATNSLTPDLLSAVMDEYGEEGLAELALGIATMRVYPCLKRALGHASESCTLAPVTA